MKPDTSYKDAAFAVMAMDILSNVLSRADNPGDLGTYLTEEVRELTGARCVLLIHSLCTPTVTEHRIVGVNPLRRSEWAESTDGNRLYEVVHHLPAAQYWHGEEPSEIAGMLRQEGFELSLVLPLNAGEFRVGTMLVLGLPDEEHISSVLTLLNNLSTIVALVLRNAFLYEKQEQLIQERTAELRDNNAKLEMELSERKRVEREIALMNFALNNVHEAAFLIDENARFNYVNEDACRVLGYTRDELLGLGVPDIDPDFPADRWTSHWQDLITERSLLFEGRHRARDGRIFPVEVSANYFEYDTKGYNLALVRDITERKQAEKEIRKLNTTLEARVHQRTRELAESEARFRTIYETAPVSIWQEDWTLVIQSIRELRAQGIEDFSTYFLENQEFVSRALSEVKILDVNQWTLGMFAARSKEDMLSSLGTVFSTADTLPGFIEELTALAQGKAVYCTEMALNTVTGDTIQGLLVMSFPPVDSPSGEVLVSVIDITERKNFEQALQKSEERMRLFFERQLVGMAITSPQKGWLQVNDKLCQMLGYSCEELTQMTWSEITFPEDLAPDLFQFDRLLKGEIDGYMLEKRFLRKDGSIVFTNLAVGCVRQRDRSVDYVLALLEDITERKRTEEKILQLNQELEQRILDRTAQLEKAIATLKSEIAERERAEDEIMKLNETLEQRVADRTVELKAANSELEAFAYSVSHDLRAPLRHIDGFLELFQKRTITKIDEQSQHYMSVISDAAKKMGGLIDDLLSFSRMARQDMSSRRVDLNALVQEVIRELEQDVSDRNIHWRIAYLPVVAGDRAMLRIVLVNLISNALKFTRPRGPAEIEIGCQVQQTENIIYIRDNGVGFDMGYADRLFGVFQRLHRSDEFEGTGIGLANVRRIISRHGGRTWAEGKVNQGSTFYFSLPRSNQGR